MVFLASFNPTSCIYCSFQDDLTSTLVQQCRQSQPTIQRKVETGGDEEAFEVLSVNDELQKALLKYEEMKKLSEVQREPKPTMIAVAAEPDEPPQIGKEESLIRKPTGSRSGNNHNTR